MTKYLYDAFNYCPLCSGKLVEKNNYKDCSKCGHRIFDNAIACVNAIIEVDNKILLTVRKVDPYIGWLDLPGGFISGGESVEEAIKREIQEELGVNFIMSNVVANFPIDYEYNDQIYKLLVLFVAGRITSEKIITGDDVSGCKFVSKSMVLNTNICYPNANKQVLKRYLLKI